MRSRALRASITLHDLPGARDQTGTPYRGAAEHSLHLAGDHVTTSADHGGPTRWDIGYMGTYSADRQRALRRLLLAPARTEVERRFVVAGPQYLSAIEWPANVARVEHLAHDEHRAFYNEMAFTLNLTRADMIAAGWSPSVRLFDAAACGVPIISDAWAGLDELFEPDAEILIAHDGDDVLRYLRDLGDAGRRAIGARACARVRSSHTATHRAAELERYVRS